MLQSFSLSSENVLTTSTKLSQAQADALRASLPTIDASALNAAVSGKVTEEAPAAVEKAPRKARETKPAAAIETKVAETKVEKAVEAVKAEVVAEDPDFFNDEVTPEEPKTPLDVKNLLIQWVGDDATRKSSAIRKFGEVTGLSSLKEVNESNASSVYAKLKAGLS